MGFLKAAAARDYPRAAEYLNLRGSRASSEDLVRRLNKALNRLSADVNRISREPEGEGADGFASNQERMGFVDGSSGRIAIDLSRVEQKNQPAIWLFSAETLRNISALPDSAEPGFTRFSRSR